MFDFKGRAKWDAWNKNKGSIAQFWTFFNRAIGMSKTEAQEKYIALVEKLATCYA